MSTHIHKGVTYDDGSSPVDCIFCRIHQRIEPGSIIFENEEFVVFKTRGAVVESAHLLVTPREHIKNLESLTGGDDALLVERMIDLGGKSLELVKEGYSIGAQYSFHIPPWNSIDHLHLHALATPEKKNFIGMFKYLPGTMWCTNAADIIAKLRTQPNVRRNPVYLYNINQVQKTIVEDPFNEPRTPYVP